MPKLYPANRTDAQIAADQKKDQAAEAAAEKEKQRQFQQLAKQLGIELTTSTATAASWREAVALGDDARGQSAPNPNVGCVIVSAGGDDRRTRRDRARRPSACRSASRWNRPGKRAAGATVYVTLEPCAHDSERGPACTDLLIAAKPRSRRDRAQGPRPAHLRQGHPPTRAARASRSRSASAAKPRKRSLAGWLTRLELGRPRITLKLALSIDGKIALPSGESKWITGEDARRHVHLERAHSDMILVGRGTYLADAPRLDVRLPGLEDRSPRRALLTRGEAVDGWETLHSPQDVYRLHDVNDLLVEGGSATASAFLAEDLVDRILIYRAPIIVGEGKSSFGYVGLDASPMPTAAGAWSMSSASASTGSKFTSGSGES